MDIKKERDLHENYNVALQWLVAMQNGCSLEDYLYKEGYKNVVVYGMNDIGNCVVRSLYKSSKINFLYAIDQGDPKLYFDIKCFKLAEIPSQPKADVIIVALPSIYEDIKDDIERVTGCKTLDIAEIVYEMEEV